MSSQDEFPASDASARTRQNGILTPLSDQSLNSNDGRLSGGKKRKRDGNTMEDLLKGPFVVRPYPSTVSARPRTLHPLVLLPRSHLPLSCLDIRTSTGPLPQSRLFETHVKILELEERMGNEPMVLIARLDDGRTLYAVEREDRGLYVLCQLGSWANLRQLRAAGVVSRIESSSRSEKAAEEGTNAAPSVYTDPAKYTKKKRLAIEAIQSMVKRPSTGSLTDSQPSAKGSEPLQLPVEAVQFPIEPVLNDVSIQLTAVEIFDSVRIQYLEALYSKASLAYFAKGPLSRARAAFHLDYDSILDMNDYITFLESLIMTTKLIDRKFSDGLPACVSLIDIQDHSADNAAQGEKSTKKKSSKKMKIAKNGLYPTEDNLVRKWWISIDEDTESGTPGTSREERTKTRISQLRIRETQLQMIVILEVLALRPLMSNLEDLGPDLPAGLPNNADVDGKEKAVKAKKSDSLTTMLDVHIDRLCIWQDIAAETTGNHGGESQAVGESSDGPSNVLKYTDNVLRDFCVEVIGPFFSARLPDKCATINTKLGGPVIVSPPKPKLPKSASFSGSTSRPGAATKRPVPAKPRQSLQRVLTNERERERRSASHGRGRSLSLMRSATAPIIPGLKRESSEAPSLSGIPAVDSLYLQASRPGVLNSKRFSQREVDFSIVAPEVNPKARIQATIEAELKEAISALKRPNRELAGKDIAETAEKRAATGSHSRKSKKPIRNPFFQGIQISATPRMNRQKDMFAPVRQQSLLEMVEEIETAVPTSSLPRVPQSATRPREMSNKIPIFSALQATPIRKSEPQPRATSNLLNVPVDYGGFMPSSPIQARRSTAQSFTAVPDSAVKDIRHLSAPGIVETPIKHRVELPMSCPTIPGSGSDKENGRGMSAPLEVKKQHVHSSQEDIYKSLGWDDGDEFDELS